MAKSPNVEIKNEIDFVISDKARTIGNKPKLMWKAMVYLTLKLRENKMADRK